MNVGLCVTGSFCTLEKTLAVVKELVEKGHNVTPILSYSVAENDTRFFKAEDFKNQIEALTGNKIISTVVGAEPIGPKKPFDVMLVMPATGNTLAKMALGITDTPVTMAVKAHGRNLRPIVIAVSTNDGLAASLKNISTLLNKKNVYFVPFKQDDPVGKPSSLVADLSLVEETLTLAMLGRQLTPVLK